MKRTPILLLFLVGGCASILGSSHETIKFHSDVPAKVSVSGQTYQMAPGAPAQVALATDSEHTATFPDGSSAQIKRGFNGWFLANLLLGPAGIIIGMPIDILTGAASSNLHPNEVHWSSKSGVAGPRKAVASGARKTGTDRQ